MGSRTRLSLLSLVTICSAVLWMQFGSGEVFVGEGGNTQLLRSKAWVERKINKTLGDMDQPKNPTARGAYELLRRGGEKDFEKILAAKKHIEAMPKQEMKDGALGNWSWLGPGNIGGRVRGLAIDPGNGDRMWAGGVGGGIWRTENGGSSWQPLNDFLPVLAVGSLHIDSAGYALFAGTGEGFANLDAQRGNGIYRSEDWGNTWTHLVSTQNPPFRYVNRIVSNPLDSAIIYAACGSSKQGEGWVFRSDDRGDTWTEIANTPNAALDLDIAWAPESSEYWLVLGTRRHVWISKDDGANWELVSDGDPGDILAAPTAPANRRCEVHIATRNFDQDPWIYVSANQNGGDIWRSTDGGDNWTRRSTGTNYLGDQGWYDNIIWTSPGNPARLIVGGIDLWRSLDGGATLTQMSKWQNYHTGSSAHADHHVIVAHPDYDEQTFPQVYFGNDGGVQMQNSVWSGSSTQGWTNLANNLGITQFYYGAADPSRTVIIGGAQDNSVLRYDGGQNTWFQESTGDGASCIVTPSDPDVLYAQKQNLLLYRSTNGGNSWSKKVSGLGDSDNDASLFIAPMALDPTNHDVLLAGGISIWYTDDRANNWIEWMGNFDGGALCSSIAIWSYPKFWIGFDNGNVRKVSASGHERLDDNGVGLPDRFVTDISFNPTNQLEVWVTFSGYFNNNVWKTLDAGATWIDAKGSAPNSLPVLPVNSVTFHPDNTNWVYVGTELGVFASEDGGQNWSRTPLYANNEGPVNTEVRDLFFAGDRLIAVTHGRGMYIARPMVAVYVDIAHIGPPTGTFDNPYLTVAQGLNAMGNGSNLIITGGDYDESGSTIFEWRGEIKSTGGSALIR